jgi:drug/metabolite transporter (DMT)-like permease
MTGSRWIMVVVLSAVTYTGGMALYRYLVHHSYPTWVAVPGILASWAFFALGYFGMEWFGRRRRRSQVTD